MRLSGWATGVATATALMAFAAGTAAAETILRYAEYGPDRGTTAELLRAFGEEIEAGTNGEVKVQFVFGGALINAKDVLRGVGDGVADMGTAVGVYTPSELFNFRVGDLPIGIDDPWVGVTAMYELAHSNATIRAEFEQQQVVPIANFSTTELILVCREPFERLEQFDGMKVRANPPHATAFEAFGSTTVSMPFPEIYQSLDRGLIACAQTYWGSIEPYRHYEVAKYVTTLDFGQNLGFGVVMNKRRFDALPAEQRQVIVEAGRKLTQDYARQAIESNAEVAARLEKENGVEILQISADDRERLLEAGRATIEQFKEKGDPEVFEAFSALMLKYEAERKEKGYPWTR